MEREPSGCIVLWDLDGSIRFMNNAFSDLCALCVLS